MKRSYYTAVFAMLLVIFLRFPVIAQSYTDDFSSTSNDDVKTYSGFVHNIPDFSAFSGWTSCNDKTVLSMGGRQTATAVYKVRGGETAEVEIYADNGTVAAPYFSDSFHLGMFGWDSFSDLRRCFYDSKQDTVFVKDAKGIYTLRVTRRGGFQFLMDEKPADDNGCYYGVNIAVSDNGSTYKPLNDARLAGIESQTIAMDNGTYFHETYLAKLPAGTEYVRLTMRACRAIRGENMPDITVPENTLLVSRVTFKGAHLQTGTESDVSKPDPESSSSSQAESSSSSQAESSPSSQEQSSSSSQAESSPSSQEKNTPSSEEESTSSSRKSGRRHNRFFYSMLTYTDSLKIDTYNGNGDTRTAVRFDEGTDERTYYTDGDTVFSKTEEFSEPDSIVVHTELGSSLKTQMSRTDKNIPQVFAQAIGLGSVAVLTIRKLHP